MQQTSSTQIGNKFSDQDSPVSNAYNEISQVITQEALEVDDHYQIERKKGQYRNWGKCKVYLFADDGEPLIVIGPHWPLFCCAFGVFFVISIIVIGITIQSSSSIHVKIMTILVCFCQLLSYLMVALRNPGIANQEQKHLKVDISKKREPGSAWYCQICKVNQYSRTIHCQDCDVCISELDHHCPWTGKCIGKGNLKEFYGFLLTTLIFMVYNVTVTFTQSSTKKNI